MVVRTQFEIRRAGSAAFFMILLCVPAVAQDTMAGSVEFQTSDRCVACHNGMVDSKGTDYSIGLDWSASLMANASRDPYWHASLRKETMDHPASKAAIEDECAACHMAIPHYKTKLAGQLTQVFPLKLDSDRERVDGVTCSVCHQITPEHLGTPAGFNGNFEVGVAAKGSPHPEFGPYEISAGLRHVMQSSTGGYQPQRGPQIQSPELCASCHTLITEARDERGNIVGSLPEQMVYQEWQHSDFRSQRTCQACHMPEVANEVPITRILGLSRTGARRHQFVGANFFMQNVLARYHDELNVMAEPRELTEAAERTTRYLQSEAARIHLEKPVLRGQRVEVDITVDNLGGHKLPTAFPARRAWLHVVLRDRERRVVFESGALNPDGSIQGNDNDIDPGRFEPHYRVIESADQVQIYEAILGDPESRVTTGLLSATQYLKDNRLLPHGFDKLTAEANIAVHGDAAADPGFNDAGHRIRYSLATSSGLGPFEVQVELWYQPIGYRWAANLKSYATGETQRFTSYYDSMKAGTAVLLTHESLVVQ